MTASDLDDALASYARPLPPAVETEARRLASSSVPARVRKGRPPRARWVLPAVLVGGVVLTAGAGTATIAMSHWSGVSASLENVRNEEPIPVSWTTDSGHAETCRVWIELRQAERGDRSALDAAIATHDWSGLGQRLYGGGEHETGDDADGESRVSRGLGPVLRTFAEQTFPGIGWLSEAGSGDRAVEAWGMTCVPPMP